MSDQFFRRCLILVACVVGLSPLVSGQESDHSGGSAANPNIIFIMAMIWASTKSVEFVRPWHLSRLS
jgi:hypothetical protein